MRVVHEHARDQGSSSYTVVRRRFRDLNRSMRNVAQGKCSRGDFHRLRIDCRRAEAMLRLARARLEGRTRRWLQRRIRELRRNFNTVRDDDVLRKWLAEEGRSTRRLSRQLSRERRRAIPKIRSECQRMLDRNRFRNGMRRVLRDLNGLSHTTASLVFGKGIFRELARYIRNVPGRTLPNRDLHRLRIASKRLRYAVEAISEIWPDLRLEQLHNLAHSSQTQLGVLRDATVRKQRLEKLSGGRAIVRRLSDEAESQESNRKDFSDWWQAQPMEKIIADASADIVALMRGKPFSGRY